MALDESVREGVMRGLNQFGFKKTHGKWLQQGRCPSCGKDELYVARDNPWWVRCNRQNSCGYEATVKELFPDAFERFNERFPASEEDPNRTAREYLHHERLLPTGKIKGWYEQGNFYHQSSRQGTATVRFYISRGQNIYMERFVQVLTINGKKRRAHFNGEYGGLWWTPPEQRIHDGDEVWIVEGVLDAIVLALSGKKVAATLSSTNFPATSLERLKEKAGGVQLVWSMDNDLAGHKAITKMHKMAEELGYDSRAAMIPARGRFHPDWNDIWKDKTVEIDDVFLNKCEYEGQLLLAPSAWQKSLLIYRNNAKNGFSFEFKKRLYWFHMDLEKYNQATIKAKEDGLDGEDKDDYVASQSGAVTQICNCTFEFLYFMENKQTDESWYFARVDFPTKKKSVQNTFTGAQIAGNSPFKTRLLQVAPGGLFTGKTHHLDWIITNHLDDIRTVKTIPFLGYCRDHKMYVYNDLVICNGRSYPINKEEFFSVERTYIKSLLTSVQLITGKKEDYNPKWADYLWDSFGAKGMIAVAFTMGTLFAEQIRAQYGSFPFLEIVGEAGAGKSTLLETLWKLMGRDNYEGFDPNKTTQAGLSRNLAQVSNLPVALIESDREDDTKSSQFQWDFLKNMYNGRSAASRGVKNSGLDTDESDFRGAIIISQNAAVANSEAIMSRICHTKFQVASHTDASRNAAENLYDMPIESLAFFRIMACLNEKMIMDKMIIMAKGYAKEINKDSEIRLFRIAETHGLLMALCEKLCDLIKAPVRYRDEMKTEIKAMAVARQRALGRDHEMVDQFWERFEFLNRDGCLNHSAKDDFIAVSLPHFEEVAGQRRQKIPDMNELKRRLKEGRRYKYVTQKTIRSCHAPDPVEANEDGPLAEEKPKRSATLSCWIFKKPD